ncbi:MAG: 50S ribosomal protein L11, partial [Candidatus Bathyarchaeia archaeon]
LISGGKATAGPPLGPALGPLGVNVVAIVNKINEVTKDFAGMKVPVKVVVDEETKEFTVEVGLPPTAALIVRELGIEKGSGTPNTQKVGNLTMQQVAKLARLKISETYAKSLQTAAKEIIGTCVSLGVTIEGKDPKEIYADIDGDTYQSVFEAQT